METHAKPRGYPGLAMQYGPKLELLLRVLALGVIIPRAVFIAVFAMLLRMASEVIC